MTIASPVRFEDRIVCYWGWVSSASILNRSSSGRHWSERDVQFAMDYRHHYEQLIMRARERVLSGYSEKHHVIPKCVGGSYRKENIVRLTPEEHYIAHILLVRIYPNKKALIYAAKMMANRSNKVHGWLRRLHAKQVSADRKGTKLSDAHKSAISRAVAGEGNGMHGRKHTEQTRAKLRSSNRSRDPSVRSKIGESRRGKQHTEDAKALMRLRIQERWAERQDERSFEMQRRASRPKRSTEKYKGPKSEDHAKHIAIAALRRPRFACAVCGQLITKPNIARHARIHSSP